jgi:hypothetical protein
MGAGLTKSSHLWQLVTAEPSAIPDVNAFFTSAISASCDAIMTFNDDGAAGGVIDEAIRELIHTTIEHSRLPVFLHFVRSQVEHITSNCIAGGPPMLQLPPVLVPAIRLCHIVLRRIFVLSNGDAIVIRKWLAGSSATAALAGSPNTPPSYLKLCDAVVVCVASVGLSKVTGRLHAEALALLLAMTSTALRHPPAEAADGTTTAPSDAAEDIFTQHMLTTELLRPLLQSLLHRAIAWGTGTLPSGLEHYYLGSAHQPSALNLYNMFGVWYKEHCASVADLVGLQSAQLLTLLCLYRRGRRFRSAEDHPVVQFMTGLQDERESLFNLLLASISNKVLTHPVMLGIAYIMFHCHPNFTHVCLTRHMPTFVLFLTNLVRVAMKSLPAESTSSGSAGGPSPSASSASASSPQGGHGAAFVQAYAAFLAVTVMLVLSQDRTVNTVMTQVVVDPNWYGESQPNGSMLTRYIGPVSLSSLQIVFLSKGVARSIQEKCDDLAAMHLAVLENVAPFVSKMDAFAAQRLVLVFTRLLKKAAKLLSAVAAKPEDYDSIADLDGLTATITAVSEAIVGMIEGPDRENYALLYELLYWQASSFIVPAQCPRSAKIASAVRPLAQLVSNYETELASVAVNHSPDDIVRLIKRVTQASGTLVVIADGDHQEVNDPTAAAADGRGALDTASFVRSNETTPTKNSGKRHALHPARDLMFVYKESDEPYVFFGPFVWACLIGDSAVVPGSPVWCVPPAAALPLFLPAA